MKRVLGKLFWLALMVLVMVGLCVIFYPLQPDEAAQRAVAQTRQALRQQGFKTDLADFNFSTISEQQAGEAILHNTIGPPGPRPITYYPNLQQPIGSNAVMVVWKLDSLESAFRPADYANNELSWDEFCAVINKNQKEIDAVCAAIMSGSIRWNLDAKQGARLRLPHLAVMKTVTQTLCSRIVIALHAGDLNSAWTNLMAATRLVSGWTPEPAEISHMVRFADTALTFGALWQALQTNGWPDEKLLRLQQEWESVNFFTNLPEIEAFNRASLVAQCQQENQEWHSGPMSAGEFINASLHFPLGVWQELKYSYSQRQYFQLGTYVDEKDLMLFYRDREVEMRNALQAPNWAAMRQLPGVMRTIPFQSKYRTPMQAKLNLRESSMRFQREGASLLGRAASAEVYRRLIITALALERFREKNGSYPNSLAELAPKFLKTVPVDFMDGQPLRYRLMNDGHFLLYSVGFDGVDDGGQMPPRQRPRASLADADRLGPPPTGDLVWPLPASETAVQDFHQKEARAEQTQNYRKQQRESAEDWKESPLRQSRVAQILATNWSPALDNGFFGGHPAAEFLRNANVVSNQISLAELMTPRQVLTGHEPEDLTFEFPVSYDAITNHGFFLLLDADMDPGSMFAPDSGAKIQERSRAANGDCQLIWHTIFDPPGQHALQVELTWYNASGAETWCRGPAISVVTSNLCQFSLDSATYDVELGATFHARLPEANGLYTIECLTTNGEHLKTLTGSTTNGEFKVVWNLVDDQGHRLHGETFNSIVHITLPDSGRTQTLRGP